uniref:Uncharacterized protein n=1 Tax=Solanum tuberosum TaxID=4113 RepID=M1DZV9_SOLTU
MTTPRCHDPPSRAVVGTTTRGHPREGETVAMVLEHKAPWTKASSQSPFTSRGDDHNSWAPRVVVSSMKLRQWLGILVANFSWPRKVHEPLHELWSGPQSVVPLVKDDTPTPQVVGPFESFASKLWVLKDIVTRLPQELGESYSRPRSMCPKGFKLIGVSFSYSKELRVLWIGVQEEKRKKDEDFYEALRISTNNLIRLRYIMPLQRAVLGRPSWRKVDPRGQGVPNAPEMQPQGEEKEQGKDITGQKGAIKLKNLKTRKADDCQAHSASRKWFFILPKVTVGQTWEEAISVMKNGVSAKWRLDRRWRS